MARPNRIPAAWLHTALQSRRRDTAHPAPLPIGYAVHRWLIHAHEYSKESLVDPVAPDPSKRKAVGVFRLRSVLRQRCERYLGAHQVARSSDLQPATQPARERLISPLWLSGWIGIQISFGTNPNTHWLIYGPS